MTKDTNIQIVEQEPSSERLLAATPVSHDLKNAILIVSVVANLIVFTTWLLLQVTSQYDASLAALLFNS